MALNKAIKYGKEHRKPYTKAKAIDEHCRNHGGRRHQWQCEWCLGNRINKDKGKKKKAVEEINEYLRKE